MREASQNIFPICAFGRAENLFYHAKASLLREDLPRERILERLSGEQAPLFPSHLLDRPDWEELLQDLRGSSPRLLIALGREWEELSPKAREAQRQGWGLDVLVDRPLELLQIPEELSSAAADVRWIVSPLRYYDPAHILRSLASLVPASRTHLCFLEPARAHGLLPNMEELMIARLRLSEETDLESRFNLLVLRFPETAPDAFFQNPNLEAYREKFRKLETEEGLRSAIGRFFRTFPTLSSVLAFLLGARLLDSLRRLQEAFRRRGQSLRRYVVELGRRIFWVGYDLAHRIFWSFYYGIPRLIRMIGLLMRRLSARIAHGFRMRLIFIRYLPGRLKALWIRQYWLAHSLFWRARGRLHQLLFLASWPARKVYWVLEYQTRVRLLPLLRKARRK